MDRMVRNNEMVVVSSKPLSFGWFGIKGVIETNAFRRYVAPTVSPSLGWSISRSVVYGVEERYIF